jgi:uncharacterized protein YjiK
MAAMSHRHRRRHRQALLLAAGFALLPFDGPAAPPAREIVPASALKEPSALAFHAKRGTIFAVGDNGDVAEIATDGKVLQKRRIEKKLDLEGVTVGPDARIYCAIEGAPAIVVLEPDTLATVRRIEIDPTLDGKRVLCVEENAGVEGICWVPELSAFFAVNQKSPARLVELALSADGTKASVKRIVADLDDTVKRCSDLAWDPVTRHFLIPSASRKSRPGKLFELDAAGNVLRDLLLPGEKQEGFCLDAAGNAYVACDSGGILRIDAPPRK